MGELASLTLTGTAPEDGFYYGYDLYFTSGAAPTTLTVPETWRFVGQDSVDGVFVPAPDSRYEMIGAWEGDVLRWVVLVW